YVRYPAHARQFTRPNWERLSRMPPRCVAILAFFLLRRSVAHQPADLIPSFGTKLSMISDEGKGKRNVEEQAHGIADDRSAEAVGGWAQGGGHGERSGGIEAHDLCLEGKVRRHGCEPGAGSEAT